MRSELVYSAGLQIGNRFLLSCIAMQAVRKLHVAATRTEDTINNVFTEVANGRPLIHKLPEIVPAPTMDDLLITPAA